MRRERPDIDERADQAYDDWVVEELDNAAQAANHQQELLRQQEELDQ